MSNEKQLKDTVDLMTSEDFRDRLKAEYEQLCIRTRDLQRALNKEAWNNDTKLRPFSLYVKQLEIMREYRMVLEARAEIIGITLELV